MSKEIERKFLVKGGGWKGAVAGVLYRQGYLSANLDRVVRVRTAGDNAYLTVKGKTEGIVRSEFEYPIPMADANLMMAELCRKPLIVKKRYAIEHHGRFWAVDEFLEENEGLVLAEVELETENQDITLPEWIGREVSQDPRYFNVNLLKNPYSAWKVK